MHVVVKYYTGIVAISDHDFFKFYISKLTLCPTFIGHTKCTPGRVAEA